ncbi:dolichol-phosphate mannosyltransferase [Thermomonospora echinospora]|uniref:Dolichol-phosphate mannosyltransferase n=1 Tax=Thermomonospora echinospora TaxID=1992 RepID=A0A1H5VIP1_9ACTN|nr:polyprenol monophosphomannose synthase [Thermomonospora echinospora]SEF86397.1 dolichol-phosphate mannosyltransferase [Thermomonospora echinospora]
MSVPPETGRVLVIIPTYNERENIERIVGRVLASAPADVLVVDDASPDGTGLLADAMAARDRRVQVLHRAGKDGLGSAYLAGFGRGIQQGYDVLVEMDADGSHRPEELPRLLTALTGADLVIGSRWVRGGRVPDWPLRRRLLSRGGNLYTRLLLGLPVQDATGGYRAYRATALEKIGLDDVQSQGYCFQVDLTLRTVRAGLQVTEVPIEFADRVRGESKMSRAIVLEALGRVTRWGISHRLGRLGWRGEPR